MLTCHRGILGWSAYMLGVLFVFPSIGGASPRPTPMLLDDCEEQAEEYTHHPRRASASGLNTFPFSKCSEET